MPVARTLFTDLADTLWIEFAAFMAQATYVQQTSEGTYNPTTGLYEDPVVLTASDISVLIFSQRQFARHLPPISATERVVLIKGSDLMSGTTPIVPRVSGDTDTLTFAGKTHPVVGMTDETNSIMYELVVKVQ